ncbi:hypothetical protein M0657_005775 [Pyricularia oryzae]|nr:hypothetical protein M9X92_005417 [Pyricularia oryzae]KAI7922155.1 hypothetical protein M0657_005775 [Pyricularia oryzae]
MAWETNENLTWGEAQTSSFSQHGSNSSSNYRLGSNHPQDSKYLQVPKEPDPENDSLYLTMNWLDETQGGHR